jgi:LysM repeat protein
MVMLAGIVSLLTGCAVASPTQPAATLEIAPPQNPYQAITSTPIQPSPTLPNPTEIAILPTATPLIHTVQPGDTLFGLALQYGITVDDLVMVNPGVDTSILSIGMELKVPASAGEDLAVPTPTPYPSSLGDPICYQTNAGGIWCLVEISNDQGLVLENLAVAFNIYDGNHQLHSSYSAITPLDYLFPDQELPAAVFIEDELPEPYQVSAVLLTSLPSALESPQSRITGQQYLYSQDNLIAEISGTVEITDDGADPKEIWVVAVGYNQGIPVGLRKWISPADQEISQYTPFELVLYSLGPPIDRIQITSELH